MADCLKAVMDEKKEQRIQINIMIGQILENLTNKLEMESVSELRASSNFSKICQVLLEEELGKYPFVVWNEVLAYIFSGLEDTDQVKVIRLK